MRKTLIAIVIISIAKCSLYAYVSGLLSPDPIPAEGYTGAHIEFSESDGDVSIVDAALDKNVVSWIAVTSTSWGNNRFNVARNDSVCSRRAYMVMQYTRITYGSYGARASSRSTGIYVTQAGFPAAVTCEENHLGFWNEDTRGRVQTVSTAYWSSEDAGGGRNCDP